MKQFRKILLVLNPEAQRQPALARASDLARQHGARLHLLTVLAEPPPELKVLLSARTPGSSESGSSDSIVPASKHG